MDRKEMLMVEKASETFSIPDRTERIFRVFLDKYFPEAEISYEAEAFTAIGSDGKPETTRPDFRIVKPNGKIIFIEITKARRNGTDPKERDRRIMKKAAPDCHYVVLYNNTLKKIQRRCKGFDFFKEEKKVRVEKDLSANFEPKLKRRNFFGIQNHPSQLFKR